MANRILWINPIGTDIYDAALQKEIESIKSPDTEVNVVSLKRGPLSLEYHYYNALVLPDILHMIKRAEQEGYDGAVIGCFYDPGLEEAREITDRLVLTAPAAASMHIAATLGHSFSIIVGRKKFIPKMMANVVLNGFREKLASFKSVELGVNEFQKDPTLTQERHRAAVREAIERDGAEVIILGCALEFGFYRDLQEEFGVPVIDAVLAPLKHIEFLVDLKRRMNWGHSKICGHETPPLDEIAEWRLEEIYDLERVWS